MVLNAEQHRQRRALQKYARNAAGKLVRAAAFRACDYTEAGLLREFSTEDAVLTFELDCYNDGSGYQVRFSSKPRATVPQEQLALQAALEQAVEEDGNQTRLQLTSVEEGLHARLDDISQRVDALRQQNPPATSALASPGDLQLMARVQKSFKVARMNAILEECSVERPPGMKMADKAALIVEKVPRDRLLNFLEVPDEGAPATKKARTHPIVPPSSRANLHAPSVDGHPPETPQLASACASLGELYAKCVQEPPTKSARRASQGTNHTLTDFFGKPAPSAIHSDTPPICHEFSVLEAPLGEARDEGSPDGDESSSSQLAEHLVDHHLDE